MANIFDIVKAALPDDLNPAELLELSPETLWKDNPYEATAQALRNCPRINWGAYLERYPDIKKNGMDPCLHFLNHGVYEGRKLTSWHSLKQPENPDAPLVSIVLINFNNAHLLDKCISSVLNQTLGNIELIIVDDCSTDNSLAIIKRYASADKRVKAFVNKQNSATLITRQHGVKVATGRYLMFLDSDDYLAPNACEIAVKAISLGYDMVKFGANIINSLNAPKEAIQDADNFCNRGENREYFNDEIVTTIFRDGKISWHVWSFIYLREICAAGFGELPSEYATGPDDLYGLLSAARRARNMLKIENRLLFYNFGPGVSATYDKAKVIKYAPAICNTILAVKRYAEKHSLDIGIETLYRNLCGDLLQRLLPAGSDEDIAACFSHMMNVLGFKYVLEALILRHSGDQERIAELVQPLSNRMLDNEIKHIGIFFPAINLGGAETMIQSLCGILQASGYRVSIFVEGKSGRSAYVPDSIGMFTIGHGGKDISSMMSRLENLEEAVRASGIDLLIHAATHLPGILWDIMAMRHIGIPVVFLHHYNFAWSFTERIARQRPIMEKAFKSADAVICLTKAEELYLRTRGINAIFIPPAIKQHPYKVPEKIPARIAILGRLGDSIKQVGEGLKVMRHVAARAPWISMCLIGDFYTDRQRNEYRKIVSEFGLQKHVILTGWTADPFLFLKQCGVLLSVSAWESFPMNISEAQSLGLPCVIYDVPIEQAIDNPSIISVPQGDYKLAAEEIISLLENPEKWHQLSRIAVENSRKYAPEIIMPRMNSFLHGFHKYMPVSARTAKEYETIIKYASFYGGKKFVDAWIDDKLLSIIDDECELVKNLPTGKKNA